MAELKQVPIDLIDPGERSRKDYGDLDEFAETIKEHGLHTSISIIDKEHTTKETLKRLGETDADLPFLLLTGGRRLQTFHKLRKKEEGFERIPAQIFTEDKDAYDIRRIELIENIQRKKLSWQEEVDLKSEIHQLMLEKKGHKIAKTGKNAEKGHSIKDTADMLDESPMNTGRDLKLKEAMDVIPEVREAKTKTEARKILEQIQKGYQTEQAAKELQQKHDTTPVGKARKKLVDSFILRNFFEGAKDIPDGAIGFMDVDPPWAMNYDENRLSDNKSDMYDESDWTPEEYEENMIKFFDIAYRILAQNSWMLVWFAPNPWYEFVHASAEDAGFTTPRRPFLWVKPKGQSRRPDTNHGSSYEMAAIIKKGKPTLMTPGMKNWAHINRVPGRNKVHPNEKPIELYELLFKGHCHEGARILIPFLGSGNGLLAASNLGFDAHGFELDKRYKDDFILKVNESKPGKYKTFANKEE